MKKLFLMLFVFSLLLPSTLLAADPVKIGFVYIMSGPFSIYGEFAKQGAELAVEEINKMGGINNRPISPIFEDETGKPDTALRAIRKLVYEDKVDILIGIDSSGVANAIVPAISEMKTPLIITHAATPDVTGKLCNKYTFRISLSLPQNVKTAAKIAASDVVATKWTTIGPDYAFGYQSWEYFQKYLKELDPKATFASEGEIAYAPTKTTDFSPYITKIMNSDADGVFISLWGGNLIDFVKQAKEMGFFKKKTKVLMTLGGATEVLSSLKEKMPEGLWVGTRYWFLANESEINKKFVDAYYKKYGVYPSYNAHGAYAAVYTFKKAVEIAKSTEKEAIVKALEGLEIEIPAGKILIRKEDHQAITDAHWGQTKLDKNYPIPILSPLKIYKGAEITPSPAEGGCAMK